MKKREMAQQVKDVLKYYNGLQFAGVSKDIAVESFLAREVSGNSVKLVAAPASVNSTVSDKTDHHFIQSGEQSKKRSQNMHGLLSGLESEIMGCSSCSLSQRRLFSVPGRGGRKVRLLVVGDWCFGDKSMDYPQGTVMPVFGKEEDVMLGKMMKALHLEKDGFFVANVVKCGVAADQKPTKEQVETCSSYLFRQIDLIGPELICAMGITAAEILLNSGRPLSTLRGKLFCYRCQTNGEIPVMPTYHPRFLLQNPEMKQAAWSDLQGVGKKLGLLS